MSWLESVNVLGCGDATRIRNYFTTANANVRDAFGRTLLHAACNLSFLDSSDVVANLLDCGVDIETRTGDGWTALHYAAFNGFPNCLRVLLRRGASMEPKDQNGSTPLACALEYKNRECATLLLDWGAQLSEAHAVMPVPEWAPAYAAGRERTRHVALILLGSRRKQHSPILASNAMDVIRMIAKVVWSTRGDELWQETLIPTHYKKLK